MKCHICNQEHEEAMTPFQFTEAWPGGKVYYCPYDPSGKATFETKDIPIPKRIAEWLEKTNVRRKPQS